MRSEISRIARKHMMDALAMAAMEAMYISNNEAVPMIKYSRETEETIARFSDFDREYHGLLPDGEYFYITRKGELLYAVNVTCDSPLTAFSELTQLIARKF